MTHLTHSREKLSLIDGSGYIFRAYFGMMKDKNMRRLTAPDGTPTQAVYVFNQMLIKLFKELRASSHKYVAIAFDTKEKTFRHELYKEYKAQRKEPPEDLIPQFALVHELVRSFNIKTLIQHGFEADDLIATAAHQAVLQGYDVRIISGDKDLMQLVDTHIEIYDPLKEVHYRKQEVKDKLGVYPEQVCDYLALTGDAIDNVPGVPKIGAKTAALLLAQFKSLKNIYDHLEDIEKKSIQQTLKDHRAEAELSYQLVVLKKDVPMAFDIVQYEVNTPLKDKLELFFERLGFSKRTFEQTMQIFSTPPSLEVIEYEIMPVIQTDHEMVKANQDPIQLVDRTRYQTITCLSDLVLLCKHIEQAGIIAIDCETTGLNVMSASLVGIAIATDVNQAYYIPIAHHLADASLQLSLEIIQTHLNPVLEHILCVGQNIKYDYHILTRHGIVLKNITHDTMILSYLLDPEQSSHGLDFLSQKFLNHKTIHFDEVLATTHNKKQATFADVDLNNATAYAAEDADITLRLYRVLEPQLNDNLRYIYQHIEMPLLKVIANMECNGIKIDPQTLYALESKMRHSLEDIAQQIETYVGNKNNLNSPKQIATLLFDKLNLPIIKKTKTGPSTDQSVLEELSLMHPVPKLLLEHRQIQKLLSTYIETLPKQINTRTKRIHTCYHQALAATGRLSSTDPNLQNIPIKTDMGRQIRQAFVAESGHVFIACDYSQIELRVLAHLSQDLALIEAFHANEDIHQKTASKLYHVPLSQVTYNMRQRAKTLNFGLIYGLSAFRLAKEENMPMSEAKTFIDAYFTNYPNIKQYIDKTITFVHQYGYVETLLGRRRYIKDIGARNHTIKQAAERVAINTPIQGTAADLIKLAMLLVDTLIKTHGFKTRMLLQVHDELVFESPQEESMIIIPLIKEAMEHAYRLCVPLKVDISTGTNWNQMHDIA